jgi:hypothetical protein
MKLSWSLLHIYVRLSYNTENNPRWQHTSLLQLRSYIKEEIAVKLPSSLAVASGSIALLMCGLNGPAIAQTATTLGDVPRSLPGVSVERPAEVARHKSRRHAVTGATVSQPSLTTPQAILAAPISDTAKLAKYASITGSCVGGCTTSFRQGDAPWHGCSISAWPALSPTCRNVGNFKTYEECRAIGMLLGWRPNDVPWYCGSLGLK